MDDAKFALNGRNRAIVDYVIEEARHVADNPSDATKWRKTVSDAFNQVGATPTDTLVNELVSLIQAIVVKMAAQTAELTAWLVQHEAVPPKPGTPHVPFSRNGPRA